MNRDTFSVSICQVPTWSGTSTTSTSLIAADTLYIPYVGVQIMSFSLAGLQNTRIMASIASSLPTPQNRLSGVKAPLGSA